MLLVMPHPSFHSQAQPSTFHCRSRQGDDPNWEQLKEIICQLYKTNKLKDVIRTMEEDYNFKARQELAPS